MRLQGVRPRRWWYLVGLAVIASALATIALYLSLRLPDTRFVAPGARQVELASAGDYVVYYEYRSVLDGRAFQTSVDLPPVSLSLTSLDTGTSVALRRPLGTFDYTLLQRSGRAILEFTIDRLGTYLLSAQYDQGVIGPETVFAIGNNHRFQDALVIGLASFMAAGVGPGIIIVTAVRRYFAGKEIGAAPISQAVSNGAVLLATDHQGHDAHTGRRWDLLVWLMQFPPLLLWVGIAVAKGQGGSGAADDAEADFTAVKYTLYAITAVLLVLIFLLRCAFRKPDSAVSRWTGSWSWTARQIALTVVAGCLCQAVGVYGFICFIANGDFLSLLGLVGAAAVALMFLRPVAQGV